MARARLCDPGRPAGRAHLALFASRPGRPGHGIGGDRPRRRRDRAPWLVGRRAGEHPRRRRAGPGPEGRRGGERHPAHRRRRAGDHARHDAGPDDRRRAGLPDRAPWNVRDFTLAEIKQLDAGSWFAPSSPASGCRRRGVGRCRGCQAGMLLEAQGARALPGHRDRYRQGAPLAPAFTQALRADASSCSRSTTPGCGPTRTWRPTCRRACSTAASRPSSRSPRPRPGRSRRTPPRRDDEATVDRSTPRAWRRTSGPSTAVRTCAARSTGTSTASSPTTRRC